jgi:hypothetical protein
MKYACRKAGAGTESSLAQSVADWDSILPDGRPQLYPPISWNHEKTVEKPSGTVDNFYQRRELAGIMKDLE